MEKSRGFSVYMAIRRIVIDSVIFRASRKSRSMVGKGIIITTRTVTTPITVSISLTMTGLDFDLKTSSIWVCCVDCVCCVYWVHRGFNPTNPMNSMNSMNSDYLSICKHMPKPQLLPGKE